MRLHPLLANFLSIFMQFSGKFGWIVRARLHQASTQHCDNSAMMLAILFSLKSVQLLENRLQPHSGATALFSMRTESQASSQSFCSVDADTWCKWAPSWGWHPRKPWIYHWFMVCSHRPTLTQTPRPRPIQSLQCPMGIFDEVCLCAVWTPPHNSIQPIFYLCLCRTVWTHH